MATLELRTLSVRLLDVRDLTAGAPCVRSCPVNTEAGLYASLVGRGSFTAAFNVASQSNPLVHTCARVCAHPCEAACRRARIDAPVSIRALKRFVADLARPAAPRSQPSAIELDGERVAVVGSGPAGLAAAYDLVQRGHPVTIFEAMPLPGGMLRYGIPDYRLPKSVLDQELQPIWDAGVELRTNVSLGPHFSIADLFQEGYRAVFLALGAQRGRRAGIDGEDLPGVTSAVDFLRDVALGDRERAEPKVVVVGGGFTAIDAARTARRLGAADVRALYRRSRAQMPSDQEEVRQAEQEGILFDFLVAPMRVEEGADGLRALHCVRTRLVPSGGSSRLVPVPVPDSQFAVLADLIILATGQRPGLDMLDGGIRVTPEGTIAVDRATMETTVAGVFAGGDAAFGPRFVIDAVADGLRAATAIDRMLVGGSADGGRAVEPAYVARPMPGKLRAPIARQSVPVRLLGQSAPDREVELGYGEAQARAEGSRCLQCFAHTVFDGSRCILCGGCIDICPQRCLMMVSLERLRGRDAQTVRVLESRSAGAAIVKDEERCDRCGLCVQRCPTGAIELVVVQGKEGMRHAV